MSKVTNLVVLNSSDKTRMYSVAIGVGAPTDAEDPINADLKTFPIGSQYTDTSAKKFYVRCAKAKTSADWKEVGGA